MINPIDLIRRCGQHVIKLLVRSTLKVTARGMENIPEVPNALIVANHSSYLDVLVLGIPFFKEGLKTRWVISQSNYNLWYLKWLYFLWKVIPLNGTVDKIKNALAENLWVIIFPEGNERWCPPGQQARKRPGKGAAVVALSTGVTIIPVGIIGADKALPAQSLHLDARHNLTVNVGKPFSYKSVPAEMMTEELLSSTTDDIMGKIRALVSEAS